MIGFLHSPTTTNKENSETLIKGQLRYMSETTLYGKKQKIVYNTSIHFEFNPTTNKYKQIPLCEEEHLMGWQKM